MHEQTKNTIANQKLQQQKHNSKIKNMTAKPKRNSKTQNIKGEVLIDH